MYDLEVVCPPLSPQVQDSLQDFKACDLGKRPAFLRVKGRLSEEGFLKEVARVGDVTLYKGTFSIVSLTLELVRRRKIRVIPLAETEKTNSKFPTHKQRNLILQLCRELNEKPVIPSTRKDASLLIQSLISRKRAKKLERRVAHAV